MDNTAVSSDLQACPLFIEHLILRETKEKLDGSVITCALKDEKYKNVREEAKLEEEFPEHIIGCKLLKDEKKIVTVTSRNILTIRNSTSLQVEDKIQCDYFATSISSLIIGESVKDLRVLFGSVIGDLIDWNPRVQGKPVQRKGHKGMIFSIVNDSSRIFTISDDRTIRMWSMDSSDIEPICTAFGHTARPFSICVDEAQKLIYTGGIEQTLFYWKYDDSKIQLIRKVVLSIGVIRKITQGNDSTLLISSQDGDFITLDTDIHEEPEEVLIENVLNFAHVKDTLIVLNVDHELVAYETEAMENIIFRCAGMNYLSSCADSAVAWNRDSIVFLDGSHVYRLKLSKNIITAIPYSNYVAVKIIDEYTHVYSFTTSAEVKLVLRFVQERHSFIPSAFLVMGNRAIFGSTAGEIESGLLEGDRVRDTLEAHQFRHTFAKKEVTCLEAVPGTSCVMALGKSGVWTTLDFDHPEIDSDLALQINRRIFSSSSRMAWPCKFLRWNGDLLIVGFYGTSLIIWNSSKAYPMVETYCGGGHREWQITASVDPSVFHFDYIRDSQLVRQKIRLDAKNHIVSTPHSSPISAVAGSRNYLVTVSLDGYISIADSNAKPLLTMFLGENLLCADVFEEGDVVHVLAGGGKGKVNAWRFCKADLERNTFSFNHYVHEEDDGDQGRVVSVKTVLCDETPIRLATFSSGILSTFKWSLKFTSDSLHESYYDPIPDHVGIGTKIAYREDTRTIYVGTSGSYVVSFSLRRSGYHEEVACWKLADRSGVTAMVARDRDLIVGCDSGHVYKVDFKGNVELIHSHLSTVVGIVADERNVRTVSLDCAVLTSSGRDLSDLSKKPTIIDMPNGMALTGENNLVVAGDGIQILNL